MPTNKKTKKHLSTRPNWIDQVIRGHLFALVILLPLLFWLDNATIFALPKLLGLHLISLSALFFILLKTFQEERFTFNTSRGLYFLGFWCLSLILSSIFSLDWITSVFGQYGRFMGLLTMLNIIIVPTFLAGYFDREDFRKLATVSIATATLVALYGLLQFFNFFGLWPADFIWYDAPQNRVFATMGHANHLGAYLAMHLVLLAASWHRRIFAQWWLSILALVLPASLLLCVLVLTASRGAFLALVVTGLILSILIIIKHFATFRKNWWKIVVGGGIMAVLLGGGAFLAADSLGSLGLVARTEQTLQSVEKGIVPERQSFLYSAWQMFLDYPVVGTGLSTFRDAYSAYRRTDYLIDGPGNAQYTTVPESAHNLFADIMAAQGVVGLLSFFALFYYVFSRLSREYFKLGADAVSERLALAILGALLVYCFQALFNFAELVNAFFLVLLMAIVIYNFDQTKRRQIRIPMPILVISLPVLLLAMGWLFHTTIFLPAQADYYLQQAKIEAARGQTGTASGFYQVAISAWPYEYQFYQDYGDFLMVAAAGEEDKAKRGSLLQQAVNNYQQAIKLNPHYPSTYHNQALAFLGLWRVTGNQAFSDLSRESYQTAIAKAPNNPRYLYEFARKLHSEWDDRAAAVPLLQSALLMAPTYQEPRDYLNFLYQNHPELLNDDALNAP